MRAVVLFLVLVLVVFAIVRSNSSDRPGEMIANEAALNWTQRAVGVLIAAIAAFALLLRAVASETLDRQFGFVLPLLGGMLLVTSHWSIALAFGAIGMSLLAKEWLSKPGVPPTAGTREAEQIVAPFRARDER